MGKFFCTILDQKVNGPCFIIFYVDNLNKWLHLHRFNITRLLSLFRCLPHFVKSTSILLITISCLHLGILAEVWLWHKYDKIVLHRRPMFHIPFTYLLTLRWILRISDWMLPGYTSDANNERKVHVKSSMIHK